MTIVRFYIENMISDLKSEYQISLSGEFQLTILSIS